MDPGPNTLDMHCKIQIIDEALPYISTYVYCLFMFSCSVILSLNMINISKKSCSFGVIFSMPLLIYLP